MKTHPLMTAVLTGLLVCITFADLHAQTYPIVDTGQSKYYNNTLQITAPSPGSSFYGQDAQISGRQPSYTDNGDGTVTDNVTGLMWSNSPDLNGDGTIDADDKRSYTNAMAGASSFNLAGYNDWRLPTIKELYSLMMFYGVDPSGYNGTSTTGLVPFMNTDYFDFGYGDTNAGERIIDAQFASATLYVSTTMNGDETMFGLNLADGRIKGYPTGPMPGSIQDKGYYVLYVRGNTRYGINNFWNNNDGTITDHATGLMWEQNDSQEGLNWQDALAWAQQKNAETYLGHSDWHLPNAKELQSLLDYTRSPSTTQSAAIDPLFTCSTITDEGGEHNYPFYWSSTTHANMQTGANAAYVCFGEALGFMEMPPNSGQYYLQDVHGAGAQRSDPKSGNPDDWPYGHGPQGDVIRIYNYVRLVRDAGSTAVDDSGTGNGQPEEFSLEQNYPNPFNPETTISFTVPTQAQIRLVVYNLLGQEVAILLEELKSAGRYQVTWDGTDRSGQLVDSGYYVCKLASTTQRKCIKMHLLK